MTGAFIPKRLLSIILGNDFSMFSLSFISLESIPGAVAIKNYFAYAQENSYYDKIGLNSGSSFVNHFRLMFLIIIIAFFHLIFII